NIPSPVPSLISPFKVKCTMRFEVSPSDSTVSVNGSISDILSSLKSEEITVDIELITIPPSTIITASTIAIILFFDITYSLPEYFFNRFKIQFKHNQFNNVYHYMKIKKD